MKRKTLLSIQFLILPLCVLAQGIWQEKNAITMSQPQSQFPASRTNPISFTIGNKIYYGSGSRTFAMASAVYFNDFFEFDLSTNTWSRKNNISLPGRAQSHSFAANGKGYACLGLNDSSGLLDDCWEYDPALDSWTQKASFTDTLTIGTTAVTSSGKLFVLSGMDSSNVLKRKVYEFDPALNSWTQKNDFPGSARRSAQSFTINDTGFVAGGIDSSMSLSELWSYNSLTDTWSQRADCIKPSPYIFSVGSSVNGYLCRGNTDSLIVYDPDSNYWYLRKPVPGFSATAALFNGTNIHVVNFSQSVNSYDENNDIWQKLSEYPRTVNAKTIVINNQAFVGSEVYDIASDSWTYNPNLSSLDYWCFEINNIGYGFISGDFYSYDPSSNSITLKAVYPGSPDPGCSFSINGKGYLGVSETAGDLWEYDPITDQWNQKSDLPAIPRFLTNSFRIADKGYLYSGFDAVSSETVNDFWQYDPVSDLWTQKTPPPDSGRSESVAAGGNLFGYVGLGFELFGPMFDSLYEYDPINDSWTNIPHQMGQRFGTVDFVYNDRLFVGGGVRNISTNDFLLLYDFYEYTPNIVNIDELSSDKSISAFPIPSGDEVILNSDEIIYSVEIFNLQGQRMKLIETGKLSQLRISLSELSEGVYILLCNKRNSLKIIKE